MTPTSSHERVGPRAHRHVAHVSFVKEHGRRVHRLAPAASAELRAALDAVSDGP